MFDFLENPILLSSLFQGTDDGAAARAKPAQRPPPVPGVAQGPVPEERPVDAVADLFSGMVEGENVSSLTPQAAATQIKEPPEKLAKAAKGFNQELYFNEGQDIERKASRMQDGYLGQVDGMGRSRDTILEDYELAGAEEHRGHYNEVR